MKLDAKQRICLALASFVMRILFPFDNEVRKAWQDFEKAISESVCN